MYIILIHVDIDIDHAYLNRMNNVDHIYYINMIYMANSSIYIISKPYIFMSIELCLLACTCMKLKKKKFQITKESLHS